MDTDFSNGFFQNAFNSLLEQITIINKQGDIVFVNNSWKSFGEYNNGAVEHNWIGTNYISACQAAALTGDHDAKIVIDGIQRVVSNTCSHFSHEYPCHSPTEQRWFLMRFAPFEYDSTPYFIVTHHNITQRKLAEDKVLDLANKDGLTKIANRRRFDSFIAEQWHNAIKHKRPLGIALVDIDYFKKINDSYGHQFGDECLKLTAETLQTFAKRSSDLCARFGGEEFIILLTEADLSATIQMAQRAMEGIQQLNSTRLLSQLKKPFTVSIGICSIYPDKEKTIDDFIAEADKQLYLAKKMGRNQICHPHL
ncbi:diguanylate cyclase [Photobacterium sanctipauli]|uniref:diguanylate cyclase n=1 Tax=Photobacterium sanctipauli TaxID=1342794 RepID=A0A2T3NZY9_9GAMM|nr:diguanylate cyclase [Photobacterium sanctipauli]PSW21768.1 diguanylate cyclase [Photobacterium sanctipauli]